MYPDSTPQFDVDTLLTPPHDRDPLMIAYHEAGHAVAAANLNHRLIIVSIEPPEEWRHYECGNVASSLAGIAVSARMCPSRTETWEETQILLAGGIAALRQFGLQPGVLCCRDLIRAIELAKRVTSGPKRGREYIERAHTQVAELLDRHWPEVERLAAALMEHKTLGGIDAMLAIMGSERAA